MTALADPPSDGDFVLWLLVHVLGAPAAVIAAASYALWAWAWWSAGRDAVRRIDAVTGHVSDSLRRSQAQFVWHLVVQVLFVGVTWIGALLAEVTVRYLSVPQSRSRSIDELGNTVIATPGWTTTTAGAVVAAVAVVVIANLANARTDGGAWPLGFLILPVAMIGIIGGLLVVMYMHREDFQGVTALGVSWVVAVVAWCVLLTSTVRDWRDYYPPAAGRR